MYEIVMKSVQFFGRNYYNIDKKRVLRARITEATAFFKSLSYCTSKEWNEHSAKLQNILSFSRNSDEWVSQRYLAFIY